MCNGGELIRTRVFSKIDKKLKKTRGRNLSPEMKRTPRSVSHKKSQNSAKLICYF